MATIKYSQKELLELLDANPHEVKAYLSETELLNAQDYILVDNIYDTPINFDNRSMYKNHVQITIYSKNYKRFHELTNYVKSLFVCTVIKTRESDYYKSMVETELIIDEW